MPDRLSVEQAHQAFDQLHAPRVAFSPEFRTPLVLSLAQRSQWRTDQLLAKTDAS